MKKRKLFILVAFATLALTGCSDDDQVQSDQEQVNENFKVIQDSNELNGSVSLEGAGVLSVNALNKGNNKSSGTPDESPQIANIALEQIAEVAPPVLDGVHLRASHVEVSGNYAIISYLKEGEQHLGGIDIIDVSDTFNPRLVNRMTVNVADISAAYFKANKLYFASAFDIEQYTYLSSAAALGSVSITNGRFEQDFKLNAIPGFAAVDVMGLDGKILALSGTNGVAGLYNPQDFSVLSQIELPDLRSAAHGDGKLAVLSGSDGIYILNPNNLSVIKNFPVKSMTNASKRTIAIDAGRVLVSEGHDGVGIYDINSGNKIGNLPIPVLGDISDDASEQVTNAVSMADGFILMANGSAGFGIAKLNDKNQLISEGVVGISGSTNYIKAAGEFIFVASGKGGLRILKLNTPKIDNPIFAQCESYKTYDGNSNLNVNSNDEFAYRGSATLKNLNVGGKLTFCGSLNVQSNANLNSNGIFNMRGSLTMGTYRGNTSLNINSNAVLRVEGSLVIYGDLNLNSGATLEFVGDDSSIHVYGNVRKNSNVKILGKYRDTSGKL